MHSASTPFLTEEQRLEAILILEGMPAELALAVDSTDYVHAVHTPELLELDVVSEDTTTLLNPQMYFAPEDEPELTPDQEVSAALNLDALTPVDVFMQAQQPIESRWKDDCKELENQHG